MATHLSTGGKNGKYFKLIKSTTFVINIEFESYLVKYHAEFRPFIRNSENSSFYKNYFYKKHSLRLTF